MFKVYKHASTKRERVCVCVWGGGGDCSVVHIAIGPLYARRAIAKACNISSGV